MANAAAGSWTDRHPELGTAPVEIALFTDEVAFRQERERIFPDCWLNVGRVEEIPHPGDYLCRPLEVCGTEVLVVRGADGALRAFHNMCSHRGNRLVRCGAGHATRFVCGFHGWAYRQDGSLAQVPDADQFFGLDAKSLSLSPIEIDTWNGFVFVRLKSEPGQRLEAFLGDCGRRLDGYPFAAMARVSRHEIVCEVNWKLALDSFQEGYHVPFVHRRSAGRAYADAETPHIHALDFSLYELHRTASYPYVAGAQPTPLEAIARQYSPSVTAVSGSRGASSGLNPARSATWAFDMFVFFPNFFLFAFDGFYFTYNFWPLAIDRTRFEFNVYFPEARRAGERFAQEVAICGLRDTLLEDVPVMEAVQSNLRSGAKRAFVLQDQELLIRHSHHVLRRTLQRGGTPDEFR